MQKLRFYLRGTQVAFLIKLISLNALTAYKRKNRHEKYILRGN